MNEPIQITEVLRDLTSRFEQRGLDEARLKAEILVSQILQCRRLELLMRHREILSGPQTEQLETQARRVEQREPIQYIIGHTDFMGRTFKVDSRALIPRPETEILVDTVLKSSDLWQKERPAVADIGTGTGCIIISLALAKPYGKYFAVDLYPDALALAEENARLLGAAGQIRFIRGDLLKPLREASLDAVVSNPPYVDTATLQSLEHEVRAHEPHTALDGGANGLEIIHALIQQAAAKLRPGGMLFMEIGEDQAEGVRALTAGHGFLNLEVTKDLAGHHRIVSCRKPKNV